MEKDEDDKPVPATPETASDPLDQNWNFKCTICGKAFPRKTWLTRHQFSHREFSKGTYNCFHCEKSFTGKRSKVFYMKHVDSLIAEEEKDSKEPFEDFVDDQGENFKYDPDTIDQGDIDTFEEQSLDESKRIELFRDIEKENGSLKDEKLSENPRKKEIS